MRKVHEGHFNEEVRGGGRGKPGVTGFLQEPTDPERSPLPRSHLLPHTPDQAWPDSDTHLRLSPREETSEIKMIYFPLQSPLNDWVTPGELIFTCRNP